jgi:hypothetical protein|tara:strand:+ start:723 stop:920 length:198 start_codon:yes stop_codon:yes gene_type:complete
VVGAVEKKTQVFHLMVDAPEVMGAVAQVEMKMMLMLLLVQQTQAAVVAAVEEKVIEQVLMVALEL